MAKNAQRINRKKVTNKNTGSDNDEETKQDNESEPEHDTVAVESPCQ